ILGQGPDTFVAALPRFRSDTEPFEVQDNPTTSAHSWVAQVAATSGIAGLTAFIAISVVGLILTFRGGFHPMGWAAIAALGAFLGAGLTTVNAIATDWLFWAAAGAVASRTSLQIVAGDTEPARPLPPTSRQARAVPAHKRTIQTVLTCACVGIGLLG